MSEEMASYTDAVDIYVPLLNEGTDVIRPTKGIPFGGTRYKILPAAECSADLEEWEFPPGSMVECRIERREGKQVLVARRRAME